MLWKQKHCATVIGSSRNHIDHHMDMEGLGQWRLRGYYGFLERQRHCATWNMLRSLSTVSPRPWCCIEDFNYLFAQHEKKGRHDHPMEFDIRWVSLMMTCLTSVRYTILHDGKELGPINQWSYKKLSRVSKEVLLKSVAQAIPNFAMHVFLLSKGVCKDIERMLNSF